MQLEQALEVSEKDVKDASAGVLQDLQRFQKDKEADLRRYMVCMARVPYCSLILLTKVLLSFRSHMRAVIWIGHGRISRRGPKLKTRWIRLLRGRLLAKLAGASDSKLGVHNSVVLTALGFRDQYFCRISPFLVFCVSSGATTDIAGTTTPLMASTYIQPQYIRRSWVLLYTQGLWLEPGPGGVSPLGLFSWPVLAQPAHELNTPHHSGGKMIPLKVDSVQL
jgi:hypothetical protein